MQHLTIPEIKTLLHAIPQPRHRLMILVAFHHGLRASEVTGLTGTSIRDGFVRVKRLKGSLETIQQFVSHPDPELDEAVALTELSRAISAKSRLFPISRIGFYKLMQRAGSRAGLPAHKMHPHVLKHSIAMATIESAGIHIVRQRLGHKSISSTGAYLRVSDAVADAAIATAMGSLVGSS